MDTQNKVTPVSRRAVGGHGWGTVGGGSGEDRNVVV